MTIFDEINAFLLRTGMTQSAFGQAISSEPSLVSKLRNGDRSLSEHRVAKMRQFMRENQDVRCEKRGIQTFGVSGSGVNVASNPDLWEDDAVIASSMLLQALLRHHPARCGA